MADFFRTDRFSTSDEASIIRGGSEAGNKGAWENVFHEEEVDTGHSGRPVKGERLRGGGTGGIDTFFQDPGNSDPELIHLYKEFVAENELPMYLDDDGKTWLSLVPQDMSESGAKEKFALWLSGDDEKIKDAKNLRVQALAERLKKVLNVRKSMR